MKWLWLAASLVCACAKSDSIQCGAITCSSLSVCVGDNQCVLQTQVDACAGKPELASCSYPGETDGICHETACIPAGCGNSVIEPGELCDDGNHFGGDGCSANCKSKEVCGDGAIDPIIGETCDNAAANSDARDTTCHTNCQVPRCGDKIVDPGEFCDDGNNAPGDGCRADCTGRWTAMASGTYEKLTSVWATADGSVAFAVGQQGTILRYAAAQGTWTAMAAPPPPAQQLQAYTSVWGTSASDVWAVSANPGNNGRLDHFDGTSWTVADPVANRQWATVWAAPGSGPRFAGPGSTNTIYATMSGTTRSEVVIAAGIFPVRQLFSPDGGTTMYVTDTVGNVYMCSGAACAISPWTDLTGGSASKRAQVAWGTSATNMFGFSDHLVAINGATITSVSGTATILGGDQASAMSGVPGEMIVIGGDHGRISVFDGTTSMWTPSPPPLGTNPDLEGVFSWAVHKAFVVGDNGTILY